MGNGWPTGTGPARELSRQSGLQASNTQRTSAGRSLAAAGGLAGVGAAAAEGGQLADGVGRQRGVLGHAGHPVVAGLPVEVADLVLGLVGVGVGQVGQPLPDRGGEGGDQLVDDARPGRRRPRGACSIGPARVAVGAGRGQRRLPAGGEGGGQLPAGDAAVASGGGVGVGQVDAPDAAAAGAPGPVEHHVLLVGQGQLQLADQVPADAGQHRVAGVQRRPVAVGRPGRARTPVRSRCPPVDVAVTARRRGGRVAADRLGTAVAAGRRGGRLGAAAARRLVVGELLVGGGPAGLHPAEHVVHRVAELGRSSGGRSLATAGRGRPSGCGANALAG